MSNIDANFDGVCPFFIVRGTSDFYHDTLQELVYFK